MNVQCSTVTKPGTTMSLCWYTIVHSQLHVWTTMHCSVSMSVRTVVAMRVIEHSTLTIYFQHAQLHTFNWVLPGKTWMALDRAEILCLDSCLFALQAEH